MKYLINIYIIYLTKAIQTTLTHSTFLSKLDPKTALFYDECNKEAKVKGTKKAYIGAIKKFIDYALSVNHNPFYKNLSPLLVIYYCLHRINDDKIKSLKNDISAIQWFTTMLGHSLNWKKDAEFIEIKKIIHKLFFVPPERAEPVFPSMIKTWLIKINVNVYNAKYIPFSLLLKVTVMTLYSITGMRTMELLLKPLNDATNGVRFKNIFIDRCKYFEPFIYESKGFDPKINSVGPIPSFIKLIIDAGQYKNAKLRLVAKDYIIGDTFDDIYNPYKYFLIYLKRLKQLKLSSHTVNISPNDHIFQYSNGKIVKSHIAQQWLNEILVLIGVDINDGLKHTLHGIRAGIATWLRAMKVPIEKICNFIGWSDAFLKSSAYCYFRFSDESKARLATQIANFKPKQPLTLIN